MSKLLKLHKRATYTALTFGLMAVALCMLALSSGNALAAPAYGSQTGGSTSPDPSATPTPRPIKLRPWVQFGHARPGETAHYTDLLFNHVQTDTTVNLEAASLWQGWNVSVNPSTTTALPGYANLIHIAVHVPMNPAHWIDVERVRAVTATENPYTTTAHLITITHRRPWTDLSESDWADDYVQYLADQNIISGYPDGSFRPNASVTRAQFAKMVVGAMQWTLVTPPTPSFSDVPADFWGYSYIETAYAHGIITGYSDGTFRPNNGVTRAQVAKLIYLARQWGAVEGSVNLSDVQQGDWYYTYVQATGVADVMSGYSDNTFRPNASATRGQVAKILALALFSEPTN
jgi:hypothetical protein